MTWPLGWLDAYGFWGFVWRGLVLGLPIAVALPLLHPQLFEPVDRLLERLQKRG